MEDMWKYMAGGALIGALGMLAGFWSKIKTVLWRIASLFVQQVEIPTEEAHNALVAYLIAHHKRSRMYDRMYGAWYAHRRDGRYGLVAYEQYGTRSMIFWNKWVPFFYSNAVEAKASSSKPNTNNSSSDDATKIYSTITFVRGTLRVEKLLLAACDVVNQMTWSNAQTEENAKNRFQIHYVPKRTEENDNRSTGSNGLMWYQQGYYRLLGVTPDQLGKMPLHKGRALDNLIFPGRVKSLINEIELWRNNRAWYLDKGIPWKRGWLLFGPPGTGKTALARAFAEDLNMPVYVFNLAEMSNGELMRAWSDMQVNVPCVALIEDIDNVFHGRENVARRNSMMSMMFRDDPKPGQNGKEGDRSRDSFSPLTFDCLLNCLDGVERTDGIFTIVTTNDLSKIDPALGQPRKLPDGTTEFISTRPGRVDKAVELTYMEPADKKLMAKRILGEYPDAYLQMLEFIDRFTELEETPAQFQERCGQIALKCFWNETHPGQVIEQGPPPRELVSPQGDAAETVEEGAVASVS